MLISSLTHSQSSSHSLPIYPLNDLKRFSSSLFKITHQKLLGYHQVILMIIEYYCRDLRGTLLFILMIMKGLKFVVVGCKILKS